MKGYADVVVIGSKIKEELFPDTNGVLGKKIKIKGRNFRVIGILEKKGQGIISFDEAMLVPYTTAQQYILGIKYYNHIIGIFILSIIFLFLIVFGNTCMILRM